MAVVSAKAFFAYQRDINSLMQQRYGVTYSEVRADLHDDNQHIKSSFDNGVSAVDIAQDIGYQSGFKSVDEKGVEYAAEYNRRKAALLQFASEENDFLRGNEGTLFMPYEGGVVTLTPVHKSDSNLWAFRAEIRDGAVLNPSMLEISNEGIVRDSFEGWDIEVVNDWVQSHVVPLTYSSSLNEDKNEISSPGFY
jgi:hypothetical protein